MPPKKKLSKIQKAQQRDKREKVVADKTFGLKNKNKSKKVQRFVNTVKFQQRNAGKTASQIQAENKKLSKKELAKLKEAELMNKVVKVGAKKTVVPLGVDPKSVICSFFQAGTCKKGKKCRYSHDIQAVRKVAKRDLYTDSRDADTMETWDQAKLEEVVTKKNGARSLPPTKIICKFFLDAIETSRYGWFWECPNGKQCHYKHCLPPGFVLRKKDDPKEDANSGPTLEETIEAARKALDLSKCTPITQALLAEWKKKRVAMKVKNEEEKIKKANKKGGAAAMHGMSGRALFRFDPTLFVDDDDAAGDEINQREDWDEEEERKQKESDETKSAEPVDASLFLDDEDLPSSDDDE